MGMQERVSPGRQEHNVLPEPGRRRMHALPASLQIFTICTGTSIQSTGNLL